MAAVNVIVCGHSHNTLMVKNADLLFNPMEISVYPQVAYPQSTVPGVLLRTGVVSCIVHIGLDNAPFVSSLWEFVVCTS
jgi:predicted phosphodiesterase